MNIWGDNFWSINVIDLPQNDTMIYPTQHNEFIEPILSVDVREITVWSVNAIDLP